MSTAQGNNARMQEKNSGREPVVWVADVRCEGVDCRQNTRTQECKKCAKVEEILYLYGVKMYRGGEKDGNIGGKWRMFLVQCEISADLLCRKYWAERGQGEHKSARALKR